MSDEYRPGKDCKCHAMSAYECCCDNVDWTDPEVYRLRAEVTALLQDVRNLVHKNETLRKWVEAQAIVNGKGSEREARLLAEKASLGKENARLQNELAEASEYRTRLDWLINHASLEDLTKLPSDLKAACQFIDEEMKK